MPKSSVQGRQTLAYYIVKMKHLYQRHVTVHGLDTGIFGPAGLVYNDEIWSLGASIKASFGAQNKHDLNQLHSLVLCHFVGFRGLKKLRFRNIKGSWKKFQSEGKARVYCHAYALTTQ